jgi:hypothetical protein
MGNDLFHILITLPLFRPQAYLDPNSGSFLIQLLIGGLVAVGFALNLFKGKIKAFFNRLRGKKDNAQGIADPQISDDDSRQ